MVQERLLAFCPMEGYESLPEAEPEAPLRHICLAVWSALFASANVSITVYIETPTVLSCDRRIIASKFKCFVLFFLQILFFKYHKHSGHISIPFVCTSLVSVAAWILLHTYKHLILIGIQPLYRYLTCPKFVQYYINKRLCN